MSEVRGEWAECFDLIGRQQWLKPTHKVCRRASRNTQHIKLWGRCATTAEVHMSSLNWTRADQKNAIWYDEPWFLPWFLAFCNKTNLFNTQISVSYLCPMTCVDNFITWSNSFSVFSVHVRFVFICRSLHGPMQKTSTPTAVRKYNQAISVLNYRDWSWYVMEEVFDPDFRARVCSYGFSLPSLSTQILIGPSFMQTRETYSVHTVLTNFMEA